MMDPMDPYAQRELNWNATGTRPGACAESADCHAAGFCADTADGHECACPLAYHDYNDYRGQHTCEWSRRDFEKRLKNLAKVEMKINVHNRLTNISLTDGLTVEKVNFPRLHSISPEYLSEKIYPGGTSSARFGKTTDREIMGLWEIRGTLPVQDVKGTHSYRIGNTNHWAVIMWSLPFSFKTQRLIREPRF